MKKIKVLNNLKMLTKEETVNKIINQTKSINDKKKKFMKSGIVDYNNFIHNTFTNEEMKYINGTGNLTKSKSFYNDMHIFKLKNILIKLAKINNHEIFGTVKKYNDNMSEQWNTLTHTIKDILLKRGYSEDYINKVIYTKNFYNSLNLEFEQLTKNYGSEQAVEKIFLNYAKKEGLSRERVKEGLNNIMNQIENNKRLNEIEHKQDVLNDFMNTKEGKILMEKLLRGDNLR